MSTQQFGHPPYITQQHCVIAKVANLRVQDCKLPHRLQAYPYLFVIFSYRTQLIIHLIVDICNCLQLVQLSLCLQTDLSVQAVFIPNMRLIGNGPTFISFYYNFSLLHHVSFCQCT